MLRCLYDPRYDSRPPDGNGMPTGSSPAAQAQREQLAEAVIAGTPRPLWGGPGDYADLVGERLRALSMVERIDNEIRWTERAKSMHEYDYDPLKY